MNLVRKNILNITPYQPGKPIDEVRREFGLKDIIKLASNENPLGVSSSVIRRLRREILNVNRYPDGNCFYLKEALAKKSGLKPSNFCCGNGSDESIDTIIKTFVEEDEEIITSDNTFLEYEIISKINDRKIITVPMTYFRYDLDAIKKRVTKKTKVIFIANPNNPTGTYVSRYELEEFFKDLPCGIIVVLDEAYDLFVDVDDFPKSLSYLENKNIIILKTFSKSYGLAGLRLGYAIASPEMISYMERVRPPFNVNILAQAAGVAALKDDAFLQRTRKIVLEGKRYLYEALDKSGIPYIPSVANFILIDTGKDGVGVFKYMLKRGVIVRDMKQYGLRTFIRVTVGSFQENKRFIKILKEAIK